MVDTTNQQPIYMDYAAATPMDERVVAVMQPYFTEKFYNPSTIYTAAREVREELESARGRIAFWLGARPTEVLFTAGATEANNLAIRGLLSHYADAHVITSNIEHDSVLTPAGLYDHTLTPVLPSGRIDLTVLKQAIQDNTVLVSVGYVNNEIGAIQPLQEVAQIVAAVKKDRKAKRNNTPLYLHTDAAQAAQYLDLHVDRLGVDLLSLNGGKIYGPKQSGILYVRGGVVLDPQIFGGGQEFGMRSGTENVAASIGLAEALERVQKTRVDETKRLEVIRNIFIDRLEETIPNLVVNGSKNHRIANNVSVRISGLDGERMVMMLDEKGIICNTGAACSAQKDESSHVIKALGYGEADARGTLRFTLGKYTNEAEIEKVVAALKTVVEECESL